MNLEKGENGADSSKDRVAGNDPVVRQAPDDLARLLIKIRRGEGGYDLVIKFLDESRKRRLTHDPRS
jgi:hypothetical protein